MRATKYLMYSIKEEYVFDAVVFEGRPIVESMVAPQKHFVYQLAED